MSKGKSRAGTGKSDNNGKPCPSGSSTFKQAMSHINEEEKFNDAMDSLEDKGKVEVSRDGRRFDP
jgi:hypothetical protein